VYQRSGDRIIIERATPVDHFTVIPNQLIRDSRLSRFARSCLIEILSSSPGWRSTADDLWRRAQATTDRRGEGRAVYRRAFREMESAGYLTRTRAQDPDGTWHTVLHFRAVPLSADAESSQVIPTDQKPVVGSPVVGQPVVNREVPPQRNYRSGSTELSVVASRRAQPAVTRDTENYTDEQKIAAVQRAVIIRGWDVRELDDEEALDIWAKFIGERKTTKPVKDPVAFFYSGKTGNGCVLHVRVPGRGAVEYARA
jgi:hypothetical protein